MSRSSPGEEWTGPGIAYEFDIDQLEDCSTANRTILVSIRMLRKYGHWIHCARRDQQDFNKGRAARQQSLAEFNGGLRLRAADDWLVPENQ